MLVEILREARRFDEALTVCDEMWRTYGSLKSLQDRINILALRGDIDGAEACAVQLLSTSQIAAEQRRELHQRLIRRRAMRGDWEGAEACCRGALTDQPGDHEFAWGLISAQLNQDRWEMAWDSYRQMLPEIHDASTVRAWVELHLRFGFTPESRITATTLMDRFNGDRDAMSQLARLNTFL